MVLRSSKDIIETLGLERHDEGGYFRQTIESEINVALDDERGHRPAMNSIFYLLTKVEPIGYLHRNRSHIHHFFHGGGPLEYLTVSPEGNLHRVILGPDLANGHVLQMSVPGGWWKATRLLSQDYGLLSEVVVPGFDYRDRDLASEALLEEFPHLSAVLRPLIR